MIKKLKINYGIRISFGLNLSKEATDINWNERNATGAFMPEFL
jgi:hypothetical protein